MTTLPTWLAALVAIAASLGPIVAAVALIVGWLQQRGRQKHERKLQRDALLLAERQKAYAAFFVAARSARAVKDRTISADLRDELLKTLREAHAAVELLCGTKELDNAAEEYYEVCKRILENKSLAGLKTYSDARGTFLERAKAELNPV